MMKAFFISIFFMNPDYTLSEKFIGRLPSCAYAQDIVRSYMQRNKKLEDNYAGYLCMVSRNYWDNEKPKREVIPYVD